MGPTLRSDPSIGDHFLEGRYETVTVLLIVALALEWATGTLILSAFRRR